MHNRSMLFLFVRHRLFILCMHEPKKDRCGADNMGASKYQCPIPPASNLSSYSTDTSIGTNTDNDTASDFLSRFLFISLFIFENKEK